jgi:hypothetical protein
MATGGEHHTRPAKYEKTEPLRLLRIGSVLPAALPQPLYGLWVTGKCGLKHG